MIKIACIPKLRRKMRNLSGNLPDGYPADRIRIALASPRLLNLISMMRSKALVAALSTLVCLQLGLTPSLARPTRSIARPNANRLIISPSAQRTIRERGSIKAVSTHISRAEANKPRVNFTRSHRAATIGDLAKTSPRSIASARDIDSDAETARVHAWIRSRSLDQPDNRAHSPSVKSGKSEGQRSRISADSREEAQITHLVHASTIRPIRSRGHAERHAVANQQRVYASHSTGPFAIVSDAPMNSANAMLTVPRSSIDGLLTTPLLMPVPRISSLYDSRGRLVVPPPLYGSHENLLHQNEMATRDGLDRIRDDADLLDLCHQQKLVPLPQNDGLRIDASLPENRRYSRPWTATFLSVLSHDYYATFHQSLQVDSAVRTIAVQQRLTHSNGNAAPSTGDNASPHLTGQAVDIAKRGLTVAQIAWMRNYLQPLIDQGKIDVEEEFRQACFHISVYRNYVSMPSPFNLATAR